MRLLLMRHGIAAPLGDGIKSDAQRPLTEEGRQKTRAAVHGLLIYEPQLDFIATSPLLRARQTADIVHDRYSKSGYARKAPSPQIWPELESADYTGMMQRLNEVDLNATILCTGHEPGLSRFAAQLLTGSPDGLQVEFKKASVCALELDYAFDTPHATLLYHMTPKQLRLLRRD
jgi:phosphohistidine phosphatase